MSRAVTQCTGASTSDGGSPAKSWNRRRAGQEHNVSQRSFHTHTRAWSEQRAGRSTARRPRTDTLPLGLNRRLFLHACLQPRHGTACNLIAAAHGAEWSIYPNVNWLSTMTSPAVELSHAMSCRLGQRKTCERYFSPWQMKLVSVENMQILEFALIDKHRKKNIAKEKNMDLWWKMWIECKHHKHILKKGKVNKRHDIWSRCLGWFLSSDVIKLNKYKREKRRKFKMMLWKTCWFALTRSFLN